MFWKAGSACGSASDVQYAPKPAMYLYLPTECASIVGSSAAARFRGDDDAIVI